ncbi:MAG: hypothetical protein HF975_06505 [ANME-2 cluster archaeon]|nr:hypothetical protein [ANME-2 cluster archaeon]
MGSTIWRCENLDVLVLMGSSGKADYAFTVIGRNVLVVKSSILLTCCFTGLKEHRDDSTSILNSRV